MAFWREKIPSRGEKWRVNGMIPAGTVLENEPCVFYCPPTEDEIPTTVIVERVLDQKADISWYPEPVHFSSQHDYDKIAARLVLFLL